MEPLEYLRIVRTRWPIVAAALALAVVVVWVTTPDAAERSEARTRTRTYTATHTLVAMPGASQDANVETMALLATRGEIPRRVVDRLDWDIEPALLAGEVSVTANANQGLLEFSATGPDGERAARIADTFAEETIAYFEDQLAAQREPAAAAIREQMAQQQERIRALDEELRALPAPSEGEPEPIDAEIIRSRRDATIRQHQRNAERLEEIEAEGGGELNFQTLAAAVPVPNLDAPSFEPPASSWGRLPIALGLALLLGGGLALFADRVDTKVRTRRGAEGAFGLPVVTEVPKMGLRDRRSRTLAVLAQPTTNVAEAYRILRLSLQLMPRWILPNPMPSSASEAASSGGLQPRMVGSDTPPRVVLVTSPDAEQGKTVTVANLAASYAEAGKTVCVLDCDLRAPDLHRYLGTTDRPGVTDFIGSECDTIVEHSQRTKVPGVWLVPGGTPVTNPGRLLGPDQVLVLAAMDSADVVIIDSGPLLAVTDPAALMPYIDAVVVVARSGHTTGEAAGRTRELLARLQAPVLGVALTGVPPGIASRSSSRPSAPPRAPTLPRRSSAPRDELAAESTEGRSS